MKYYSTFSVGDYELDEPILRAEFRRGKKSKRPMKNMARTPAPETKRPMKNMTRSTAKASSPGVRRAHVRTVRGKAQMVGQSILKAGKSTAGKLSAGGAAVLSAGKKYGGQALGASKTLAMQGVGVGASYAGRAGEVIAKNPKTAGIVAGVGAAGAGGAYLLGRKKKRRI